MFLVFVGQWTLKHMEVEDTDDDFTYSELESAESTESITMVPLTLRHDRPPAPPPRYGSQVTGSRSTSTAVRTGCSTTAARAQRQTTTVTSGSSAADSLNTNVVKNMAYRHRSPDVIPSISK